MLAFVALAATAVQADYRAEQAKVPGLAKLTRAAA
jgi:hypothetical protein